MEHKGTQTIRTKRLILRRFTVDDAETMFRNWANDPEVTRFLTWEPHSSPELTRQLLAMWCKEYCKKDFYNWVIEFEGEPIGNISVVRFNRHSENADLGYCIGRRYWGQGIMPEAAQAVIDYLFDEVGVHRVEISHAVGNPHSGKVAQKCGLRYEGTKRESFKTLSGEFLDISYWGIVRGDWENERGNH